MDVLFCRPLAVVATARKLVTIVWHMLKNNEPYRYAQPRLTADKLARLRVKATGKRRTTGPKKGVKCQAKLPGGSRTIKRLAEVYREEELPELRELPAGEKRMLHASGTASYAQSLTEQHIIPRRSTQAATR